MVLGLVETTRVCTSCGTEKPIEEFYFVDKKYRQRKCISCCLKESSTRYQEKAERYARGEYHPDTRTSLVCSTCGIEKPINDFYRSCDGRHHTCKICYCKKSMDYHHRTWDDRYARLKEVRKKKTREYWAEHSAINKTLYGTAQTPKQRERQKQRCRIIATKNQALYGIATTPEQLRKHNIHFRELRQKALLLYGNKCECCGESRYDMLTFDHKIKAPRSEKFSGVRLVYDVICMYEELGYPNKMYQILCWNCNLAKGFYGACPHKQQCSHNRNKVAQKSWDSKLEMINHYGGKCQTCGEVIPELLTIDHVNGGGNRHRQEVGSGAKFRRWLRNQGWPQSEFRLLCANCNCSKKQSRWGSRKEGDPKRPS